MKIILTIDGSEFSRAATEKCCEIIAAPDATEIKIVSVYEVVEPMDVSISPEFSRELETAALEKAQEFAAEAAAEIRKHFPDINLTVQTSTDAPDRVFLKTAEEWRADLMVVGSHGRGFWGRTLLGSVTDALVHNAPCSVLVARKTNRTNA